EWECGASPRKQMLIVPEGAHFSETDIALFDFSFYRKTYRVLQKDDMYFALHKQGTHCTLQKQGVYFWRRAQYNPLLLND
ncbi:MAG: hypothetical protein MR607_04870, partial [Lachnospiraceae bacterium]|nr:hypothetical protein [Lachnospiraceae bacterium]